MRGRRVVLIASLVAVAACAGACGGDDGEGGDLTQRASARDGGDGGGAGGDDAGGGGASGDGAAPGDDGAGLPAIVDASGASASHVHALVRAALDGLGFDPGGGEGPSVDDRVFVGRRYLAWIDQTGFYGKMNGLWMLDGAAGDALDFVMKDPDGRPVNVFVPGEDGEGTFAPGYKGSEHVEFPNRTPEPNDDPGCAQRDWCNQYGLNEAAPITNPKIPWWSACNRGAAGFDDEHDPVSVTTLPDGGVKLVYEGPLVKEADGDGNYDGDACHEDYLFPDGVRRRVLLRVGYELHPNEDYVDRTQQIVNPAGNPSFAGDMSLIGGFVMTAWPNPHYQKRFHRFWRPEQKDVTVTWNDQPVTLTGAAWTDLHARALPDKDVVVGWANQPFTIGAAGDYVTGRTATVANVGPSDNGDVGSCLCLVHGAIEMGGGLIHAGTSLPISGGQSTIEAKRRLTLPRGAGAAASAPRVSGKTYDPVAGMQHKIGRAESDGWSAATASDAADHMVYGPYATDWGGGAAEAIVRLMVDDVAADDLAVVTLEIHDATTDTVVASRDVHRKELRAPMTFQRFTVDADLGGHQGHSMEVRVYWRDVSYVKIGSVAVALTDG